MISYKDTTYYVSIGETHIRQPKNHSTVWGRPIFVFISLFR
jgi:hypothetical protein